MEDKIEKKSIRIVKESVYLSLFMNGKCKLPTTVKHLTWNGKLLRNIADVFIRRISWTLQSAT
jgi:hypothetical protein